MHEDVDYLLKLLSGDKEYANKDSIDIEKLREIFEDLEHNNDEIIIPIKTQRFISQLSQDDLKDLKDSLQFIRNIKTLVRIFKWCMAIILSIVLTITTMSESFEKLWHWISNLHS